MICKMRCDQPFHRIMPALSTFALLLIFATGCNTVRPLPPADFQEPGWTVRQGQAVWKRSRHAPEVAGEILIATKSGGRAFVQFSKNPFPLVIAQSTAETWQVEIPAQNKRYSGRGRPPARLIFLYLPRMIAGEPPPRGWSWKKLSDEGWRLDNQSAGESLEVYFAQ